MGFICRRGEEGIRKREKEEKKMSKKEKRLKEAGAMKYVLMAVVAVLLCAGVVLAQETDDVTVTVAPIVSEAFTVTPDSYAFGSLALSVSSNSASGLTIENTGDVGMTFEKTVQSIGSTGDAWTLATSTGTQNEFVLYAMTKATKPGIAEFDAAVSTFSTTLTTYNDLVTSGDSQVDLNPSATADLWLCIDMPSEVSTDDAQTITVRLRGTAK